MPIAKMLGYIPGQFDDHARVYTRIDAVPLAAAIGAEIRGVDCANFTEEQFTEIRDACFATR